MNRDVLRSAIENGYIEWQRHSLERMFERGISREDVKEILRKGEIIEDYPDDKPYPSVLFLGWINEEPLHVVAAIDLLTGWGFVITAYKPDLEHFESDYKTRRQK
ncbi:MAG: DUF4258 domain-containing protein [Thermodesulfovibrionales bacterium]|nr:DUF4258 domain-containing protein [Nitrospinota bacterium]MCG2708990.1 DUF4258 domain-containing protein [Thermodesulfovibrionales bacterium]MDP3048692.1 DUF4258 domain-containing protein [Thermodesulfovibrionales bacterium]